MTKTKLIKENDWRKRFEVLIDVNYHNYSGERYTNEDLKNLCETLRNTRTFENAQLQFLVDIADIIKRK